MSLDTAKQSSPADISIVLPKDLKKAADGALKGDVALTFASPAPIKVTLPAPVGKQQLPPVPETRLDVDLAPLPGRAIVQVKSPVIPGIKFPGKKASDWNIALNLGSGEAYYFNTKTGATSYDAPF